MTRIIALSLAIATGTAAAFASDGYESRQVDPATAQAISEMLLAEGYDVTEIEAEDNGYEAYAMKDGVKWEVELNADLAIVEVEQDDD